MESLSLFLLGAEDRRRFLQFAGRVLGCTYICTWAAHYHPASNSHLICTDGWHQEEGTSSATTHRCSTSSAGLVSLRLFDAYRSSLCSIQSGRIPGLAFNSGLSYIEIKESDLMSMASMNVQGQFYQEAGIKTAVFAGYRNGEIELGLTTPVLTHMNLQMKVQQVLNEDFIRQFLIVLTGEFLNSSPLSSSPPTPRLLSAIASTSTSPPTAAHEGTGLARFQEYADQFSGACTPPPDVVDQAAAPRTALEVISSAPSAYHHHLEQYHPPRTGAFEPYRDLILDAPLKLEATTDQHGLPQGQRMIKTGIGILRRVNIMRRAEAQAQELYRLPAASVHQMHRVMSERRRRVKLKENLNSLRLVLPPCSKKDNASVLLNARTYLNSLKSRIKELDERNRPLEMQLRRRLGGEADIDEMITASGGGGASASSSPGGKPIISVSVTAREECDVMQMIVRVMGCLKGMRDVALVSMDASAGSSNNPFARVNLRLQVEASDWDEEGFKEALTKAAICDVSLKDKQPQVPHIHRNRPTNLDAHQDTRVNLVRFFNAT